MSDGRKVPQGRLARLSQFASLGAKAGVTLIAKRGSAALATETANVLGIREGAAWARYARALAKLRETLADLDGSITGPGWEEAKR